MAHLGFLLASVAIAGATIGCTRPVVHATENARGVTQTDTPIRDSAAVEVEQLRLPDAGGMQFDIRGALEVRVTDRRIFVAGTPVLTLPHSDLPVVGTGLGVKPTPGDLFVIPLADAARGALAARDTVFLSMDRSMPFRIVTEVMYTLWRVGARRFILATDSGNSMISETVRGWQISTPGLIDPDAFAVFQLRAGYAVKVDGTNVAPGCSGRGPGYAVPNIGDAYDLNRLTQCIGTLRRAAENSVSSARSRLRRGYLTSNPATSYQDLMSTVAALHKGGVHAFEFKVVARRP